MEDVVLKYELNESTSLYVSPISKRTYLECLEADNLGGERGYFILRSHKDRSEPLEVLAKAASFEAAEDLLNLIALAHHSHLARS